MKREEDLLTMEEKEAFLAEVVKNPSTTLWDLFASETETAFINWMHHPKWFLTKAPAALVQAPLNLIVQVRKRLEWFRTD